MLFFSEEKKPVLLSTFLVGSSLAVAWLGFTPESSIWFPFRRPGPPWHQSWATPGGSHNAKRLLRTIGELGTSKIETESPSADPTQQDRSSTPGHRCHQARPEPTSMLPGYTPRHGVSLALRARQLQQQQWTEPASPCCSPGRGEVGEFALHTLLYS